MRYLPVKKDLYLVEQEIPKQADVVTADIEPINHIWIYDRSYSMSYDLANLANDLIVRAKQLPVGDTLTLGWFSSEGKYNFILKGYKIADVMDYKILEKAIENNKTPIGMTCFSEVLKETDTVVEDLSIFSSCFALCFFTDGYPVVSSYSNEIANIQSAIEAVEGRINASLLVGYGNYYNKDLMSKMAEWFGGALVHSNNLTSFSISLTEFVEGARDVSPKQKVKLAAKPEGLIFSINGKGVNVYEEKDGHVNFVPSKKAKDYIYTLSSEIPEGAKEVSFQDKNVTGKSVVEPMVKAAYATSYILTQRTKTDVALEVLSLVGDKAILDSVVNAFTNDEYGKAENNIINAMSRPSKRFISGRSTSYLPPEDAFSLLDAIHLLQVDKNAYFYPRHEMFNYSKIGASTKQVEEDIKFKAEDDVKCAMSSLSWNAKKLNLSVLAKIQGTVGLKDGYLAHGFQENFPSHIYRNYALVKDGFLNIKQLPVSLSELSFGKLKAEGVIDPDLTWKANEVYILNLDRIPVVNRAAAKGKTSATELCKRVWEECRLKGKIKALKALKVRDIPKDAIPTPFTGLSDAQQEFLASHHITKNGFSPKVEKVEPTDFYYAKEFEIKIKGVSSLPNLEKVLEKNEKGKALTLSESLLDEGVKLYDGSGIVKAGEKLKLAWFEDVIDQANLELHRVRKDIQETKFAIILGKVWFDEFSSREDNVLTVDEHQFTIGVREVKVSI